MERPGRVATAPEDLGRLFQERLNDRDLEGMTALYDPEAVMQFPGSPSAPPRTCTGIDEIRQVLREMIDAGSTIEMESKPALRNGSLALTSAKWTLTGPGPEGPVTMHGASAEVARQQGDGSWRYLIDEPAIVEPSIAG